MSRDPLSILGYMDKERPRTRFTIAIASATITNTITARPLPFEGGSDKSCDRNDSAKLLLARIRARSCEEEKKGEGRRGWRPLLSPPSSPATAAAAAAQPPPPPPPSPPPPPTIVSTTVAIARGNVRRARRVRTRPSSSHWSIDFAWPLGSVDLNAIGAFKKILIPYRRFVIKRDNDGERHDVAGVKLKRQQKLLGWDCYHASILLHVSATTGWNEAEDDCSTRETAKCETQRRVLAL
uniref:Uncharacterized protein n=1 Tax=Vespula pensylvanica TaxID=30213 RepID=A0A834NXF1_VESPE|nr:hypothetical protein H0235_010684 [Vespula pensylvanica]